MDHPQGDDYSRLPIPRRTRSLEVPAYQDATLQESVSLQAGYQNSTGNQNLYNFSAIPENAPTPRSSRPPLPPSPQGGSNSRLKPGMQSPKEEDRISEFQTGFAGSNRGMPGSHSQGRGGRSQNEGDVPWAVMHGYSQPPPMTSSLSRTTSAPPLGDPMLKVNDFADFMAQSANTTPEMSPTYNSFAFPSAASSPDRDRKPMAANLPKTKLSRTSSCPPLDAQEYYGLGSEEDGAEGSEETARSKRKRLLAARGGGNATVSPTTSSRKSDEWGGKEDAGADDGGITSSAGGRQSTSEKAKGGKDKDGRPKPLDDPPKDYIHVRARRGQATDSHSLAERVRRERISERMRVLQDLVPTCNKATGKAVMLDEIINYVRSLQLQVEVLSSKLAAIESQSQPAQSASHAYNDISLEAIDALTSLGGGSSSPSLILQQIQHLQQQQMHKQQPFQQQQQQERQSSQQMADIASLLSGSGSMSGADAMASLGLSGFSMGPPRKQPLIGRTYSESGVNLDSAITDVRLQELLQHSTSGIRGLHLSQLQANSADGGNANSQMGSKLWSDHGM